MKRIAFIFLILITSCKPNSIVSNRLQAIETRPRLTFETLLDSTISIRAIVIDNNKVWFSANKNTWGYYDLKTHKKVVKTLDYNALNLEFRSIAQTKEAVFILSIGSPAILVKINKLDLTSQVVYQETHESVFYDSMQFWNNNEGIAIGDPIENCFAVLITRDGGSSWNKVKCQDLPTLENGETAFAASNTSICIKESNTFIVTGGKKANVLVSPNKGKSWTKYGTPMHQGQTMTGIFSADFYNKNVGFIVGGNYENQSDTSQNKALTVDGGQTWSLKGINQGFGYASCVQFIPHSKGKKIVTVGTTGIYYSADRGETWIKISDEQDFYSIRFQNSKTAFASGKNKLVKITFDY